MKHYVHYTAGLTILELNNDETWDFISKREAVLKDYVSVRYVTVGPNRQNFEHALANFIQEQVAYGAITIRMGQDIPPVAFVVVTTAHLPVLYRRFLRFEQQGQVRLPWTSPWVDAPSTIDESPNFAMLSFICNMLTKLTADNVVTPAVHEEICTAIATVLGRFRLSKTGADTFKQLYK